jgi:hypothetical protein
MGDDAIGELRRHGEADVGQRRPGSGGPGDEREIRTHLERAAAGGRDGLAGEGREQRPDRRVLGVAVVLRHLVAGKGGAAACAVGLDLVALDQEPLAPELGQRPPDRLDIGVAVGVIGMIEVDPVADALGHRPPLPLVGVDALEAGAIELGDAVGLDLPLAAAEAQALLDLDLDRQAVGVPAGLAQHAVAALGAVAREQVLDHAGHDVPDVGHVVGGRRALEEDEVAARGGPGLRLLEDSPGAPLGEHLALETRERIPARHLREALAAVVAHGAGIVPSRPSVSGCGALPGSVLDCSCLSLGEALKVLCPLPPPPLAQREAGAI